MTKSKPIERQCVTQSAADLMPQAAEIKKVLHQRAELIGTMELEKTEHRDGTTYVRFRLGKNEYYGIPYHLVSEVMSVVPLTKLSTLPEYIAGVINRRGSLSAVLDLKKFFNFKILGYDKDSYIIVIKASGITIGILTDAIEGSDSYPALSLEQPLTSGSAIKPEYVIGLDKGTTAIVNIEAILAELVLQLGKLIDNK